MNQNAPIFTRGVAASIPGDYRMQANHTKCTEVWGTWCGDSRVQGMSAHVALILDLRLAHSQCTQEWQV